MPRRGQRYQAVSASMWSSICTNNSARSRALTCGQACALLIVAGTTLSSQLLEHGNSLRLLLPAIGTLAGLIVVLSAILGVLLGPVRWYVGVAVIGLLPLAMVGSVVAADHKRSGILLRDTYTYEKDALRLAHGLESRSRQARDIACLTEPIGAPYREVRSCYYGRTGEIYVEFTRRFDGGIIYMPSGSPRREGSHCGRPLRDKWYRFTFCPRH